MAIKKRPVKPKVSRFLRGSDLTLFDQTDQQIVTIDCSGQQIKSWLDRAIDNDASEVVVRISQFGPNLEPANFQAIVRFNDANLPWACIVHYDAYQALAQALKQAAGMPGPNHKQKAPDDRKSEDTARLLRADPDGGSKRSAGAVRKRP